ncbi:tail assembly chaperone [Enterococcus mundtii]|uniref:tail assembly chaperone n=1 Tax=Enterococcus mundtii TaxID=53346 RepID=UPI0038FBFFDE
MELTINGKEYKFIFGFGFIQEMNRRYSVVEQGMTMKLGLDSTLVNFFNEEIETLIEMLKVANLTETPKVAENDLITLVGEIGSDKLFDLVLEELKKSAFTKKKTLTIENRIKNSKKK